ncbi:MAG: GNAT family N-acetyltransferase, partial [Rhodothermales bacterium]
MIRPFRESDLDLLLDVWYRASRLAHPFLSEVFLAKERNDIVTQYLPMAETWVIIAEGRLVGFVALIGSEVAGLFVDPDLHGKGYGRALLDHCLVLRNELELDVFKENTAGRRFYDRYGFEVIDERAHDETGYPLLRMR